MNVTHVVSFRLTKIILTCLWGNQIPLGHIQSKKTKAQQKIAQKIRLNCKTFFLREKGYDSGFF